MFQRIDENFDEGTEMRWWWEGMNTVLWYCSQERLALIPRSTRQTGLGSDEELLRLCESDLWMVAQSWPWSRCFALSFRGWVKWIIHRFHWMVQLRYWLLTLILVKRTFLLSKSKGWKWSTCISTQLTSAPALNSSTTTITAALSVKTARPSTWDWRRGTRMNVWSRNRRRSLVMERGWRERQRLLRIAGIETMVIRGHRSSIRVRILSQRSKHANKQVKNMNSYKMFAFCISAPFFSSEHSTSGSSASSHPSKQRCTVLSSIQFHFLVNWSIFCHYRRATMSTCLASVSWSCGALLTQTSSHYLFDWVKDPRMNQKWEDADDSRWEVLSLTTSCPVWWLGLGFVMMTVITISQLCDYTESERQK